MTSLSDSQPPRRLAGAGKPESGLVAHRPIDTAQLRDGSSWGFSNPAGQCRRRLASRKASRGPVPYPPSPHPRSGPATLQRASRPRPCLGIAPKAALPHELAIALPVLSMSRPGNLEAPGKLDASHAGLGMGRRASSVPSRSCVVAYARTSTRSLTREEGLPPRVSSIARNLSALGAVEESMEMAERYARSANSRASVVLPTRRAPSKSKAVRPRQPRFHSTSPSYAFGLNIRRLAHVLQFFVPCISTSCRIWELRTGTALSLRLVEAHSPHMRDRRSLPAAMTSTSPCSPVSGSAPHHVPGDVEISDVRIS